MENDLNERLAAQDAKLESILKSVKKTEKYFRAVFWMTILFFIVPLIGLVVVIPIFMRTYLGQFAGLL